MEHLQRLRVQGFEDATATISFIRKVNALVEALNSRTPMTALKNDPGTTNYKVTKMFFLLLILK